MSSSWGSSQAPRTTPTCSTTWNAKRIDAVIGKADVLLLLTMAGDGWQLETTFDGKTDRHTMRWADTLAE